MLNDDLCFGKNCAKLGGSEVLGTVKAGVVSNKMGFPGKGTWAQSKDVKAVRSYGADIWERNFGAGAAAMVAGAH